MDAWIKANPNLVVLIIGVVSFVLVIVEIWRGVATEAIVLGQDQHSRSISRKAEPRRFWVNIGIQVVVIIVVMVVFSFIL